MIPSRAVREALEMCSPEDCELLDLARWARGAEELDDDVLSVFAAPAFLELKLREPNGLVNLIEDLNYTADTTPRGQHFRWVANALGLAADILTRDPQQLATQLLARVSDPGDAFVGALLRNLQTEYPTTLLPISTGLVRADRAYMVKRLAQVPLKAMTPSPTQPLVAFVDADGNVALVEVSRYRLQVVGSIQCTHATALAFTPAGDRIVVTSEDGSLWIIEVSSRTCLDRLTIDPGTAIAGCLDTARLVLIKGGAAIVVNTMDRRDVLRVGQESSGQLVEFAIDSARGEIVTGATNGRVDAWNTVSGELAQRIGWFGDYQEDWSDLHVEGLAHLMATGRLWMADSRHGEPVDFEELLAQYDGIDESTRERLRRHLRRDPLRHMVRRLAIAPDAGMVAAIADRTVRVWSRTTGERLVNIIDVPDDAAYLAIDPQRNWLLLTQATNVVAWQLPRLEPAARLPMRQQRPIGLCCVSGTRLVLTGFEDGTVAACDPDLAGEPWLHADEQRERYRIAACADAPLLWRVSATGRIEEWSLDRPARIRDMLTLGGDGEHIRLSANGQRMVMRCAGALVVTDLATGLPLYRAPFAADFDKEWWVHSAVSNCGRRALVARHGELLGALLASRGELLLFEMSSGGSLVLDAEAGQIDDVVMCGSGRYAVVISTSHTESPSSAQRATLWDLDARRIVRELEAPSLSRVDAYAFSSGHQLLWCAGEQLYQLDLRNPLAAPGIRQIQARWQALSVDPTHRFIVAQPSDTRLEVRRLSDLSLAGAFDADQTLTHVQISSSHASVLASDAIGALYVLKCHALHEHQASPSSNQEDEGSSEQSLAHQIDEIGRMERLGHSQEAATRLATLARSSDVQPVFRAGVARTMFASGSSSEANALLRDTLATADPDLQAVCVDLLIKFGGREGAVIACSAASAPAALQKACDQLVTGEHRDVLTQVAFSGPTALARIMAAQALAPLHAESSSAALMHIVRDPLAIASMRATAWISLRLFYGKEDWLRALLEHGDVHRWPADLRMCAGWELVRALHTLQPVWDQSGPQSAAALPVEPLRRALEWDQAAIMLNTEGNWEAALAASSRAIRIRPASARYWFTRGMVYLSMARETSDAPSPATAHRGRRKLFELAIEDLTRALDIDPGFEKAWSQRGYAYLELDENELALHDIRIAMDIDSTDAADYLNLSAALRELGRFDEAAEAKDKGERLLETLRSSDPTRPSIQRARRRVGDEDETPEANSADTIKAARDALDALGVTTHIRDHVLAKLCSEPLAEDARFACARIVMALDGEKPLRALLADSTLRKETAVALAYTLLPSSDNTAAAETLVNLAADTSTPATLRTRAAEAIGTLPDTQAVFNLLRRLRDTAAVPGTVPHGTLLTIQLLKTLAEHEANVTRIRDLVRDTSASPAVRELAAEVIGSYVSQAEAIALLTWLADEFAADHPVQDSIGHAIAHFSAGRQPGGESDLRPEQRAFEAFLQAPDEGHIEQLAQSNSVFFDPQFIEHVAQLLPQIPAHERERFVRKLDKLRALPPNGEIQTWRAFARANSLDAVRRAVEQFPSLATRSFRAHIGRIIDAMDDPDEARAFRRRLEWLQQLPLDPIGEAVHAFVSAQDDAQLQTALALHPAMKSVRFEISLQRSLRGAPEWPTYAARLQRLKMLAGNQTESRIVDDAYEALRTDAPELAFRRLAELPEDAALSSQAVRALALAEAGRYEEALEALNKLLPQCPVPHLFASRGRLYIGQRRFREALADFDAALKLDPENGDAWLGRGIACSALDQPQACIEALTRAESLGKQWIETYTTRGVAYLGQQDLERALADFRRVIELADCAAPGLQIAELLLAHGYREEGVLDILNATRTRASAEELKHIHELEARLRAPERIDLGFLLNELLKCTSNREAAALVRREPIFAHPDFLQALEKHVQEQLPEEAQAAFQERLQAVHEFVNNPAQQAFDALLGAESEAEIRAAREAHPLLADEEFRRHLHTLVEQIGEQHVSRRLASNLATLESLCTSPR